MILLSRFRLASVPIATLLAAVVFAAASAAAPTTGSLPRLAVLTDIGGDPDDQQSLIRLMLYSNQFEIEALISSAAGVPGELDSAITRPDLIREIVAAYGQVRPHLQRHASGWPPAEKLLALIRTGNPHRGRDRIGAPHDTEGSRLLIARVDAGTAERPLNISIWGGQTDLAQAFWRVKHERGDAGWREFARKLRIYDIADQDGLADWIYDEFPGLYYILSRPDPGLDKRTATYRGMYLTGDLSLTSPAWSEQHMKGTGPLADLYPLKTWTAPNPHRFIKEGDTPSWFFFLPQGGNDPADPSRPGWGGRFRRAADGRWVDLPAEDGFDPRSTVSRWRADFQSDFARKLSWCRPPTS